MSPATSKVRHAIQERQFRHESTERGRHNGKGLLSQRNFSRIHRSTPKESSTEAGRLGYHHGRFRKIYHAWSEHHPAPCSSLSLEKLKNQIKKMNFIKVTPHRSHTGNTQGSTRIFRPGTATPQSWRTWSRMPSVASVSAG